LERGENGFEWKHRREERIRLRNWSFRISQFAIAAIAVSQIVAEWVRAVADPEAMATFLCDRKAMPESTAQKLTGKILERARRTANAECRMTNGLPSSASAKIPSAQDDTLLAPRLSGERNEERGFASRLTDGLSKDFSCATSPRPSPPLRGGEGDGILGCVRPRGFLCAA
jgi:hypothetical protein